MSSPPRPGPLLAVLLIGPFMSQADATIVNVSTPSIHADLGASGAALELVVSGYLIAFAVLLITGARLGQTHGYRRILMLGATLFTAASLLCGLAPAVAVLIAARVLQGTGAALMFPQSLTGIALNFTGAARARAIGGYALALSGGGVGGQILGGVLISADVAGSQWRSIFLINVPFGVLLVLLAARCLPADAARTVRPVDRAGIATLCTALLLLVVPLALGHDESWPLWSWVCLAAAALATAAFVATQRRVAARGGAPLVEIATIARPAIGWTLATLLLAIGSYYALLFTLAQYLQQGLGRSAAVSGLTLVPWVAAFGLAGQLVRRLTPATRRYAPVLGCLLLAATYAAISIALFAHHDSEATLTMLLGFGGLGLGIQFSALIARLTTLVPSRYAPDISGVSTTTIQIGGALGIAAIGTVYFSLTSQATGPTHAFATTTAILAAVAACAALTAAAAGRLVPSPMRAPDTVLVPLPSERVAHTPIPKRRARG